MYEGLYCEGISNIMKICITKFSSNEDGNKKVLSDHVGVKQSGTT